MAIVVFFCFTEEHYRFLFFLLRSMQEKWHSCFASWYMILLRTEGPDFFWGDGGAHELVMIFDVEGVRP